MMSAPKPEIVQKNILAWLVDKVDKIFSLGSSQSQVDGFIKKEYVNGLEKAGIQLNMNFIPSDKKIDFLQTYVNKNLKFSTDEIGNDLRQEISRGMMNGESPTQLKIRVRKVFNDKKYTNRLRMVLRTERLRASNYGSLDGAMQSGLKLKKYLDVIMDNRTSDICKAENRKYGDKSQAIPLDKEFVVTTKSGTVRALAPPFHPSCRTLIRFIRGDEE